MTWPHYVVLGVFALAASLFVLRAWLYRMHGAAVRNAESTLTGERTLLRDESANLFGVRSQGMGRVRGNGVLTLTAHRLHFVMWFPRREMSIQLERVEGVETPKSFLGKTKFAPLLQVNFTNERGEKDAAAWMVRDLDVWTGALQTHLTVQKTGR